jgi:hypothetical protein
MVKSVQVIGVDGSLRTGSTSHGALQAALDGVLDAGCPAHADVGPRAVPADVLGGAARPRIRPQLCRGRLRLRRDDLEHAYLPRRAFDSDGRPADEMVGAQMRELGAEVVRAARQFQAEGNRDYADSRQSPGAAGSTPPGRRRRPPDCGLRPSPGALVSGRPPRPPGPAAPWS